jgi:hypothetical protein
MTDQNATCPPASSAREAPEAVDMTSSAATMPVTRANFLDLGRHWEATHRATCNRMWSFKAACLFNSGCEMNVGSAENVEHSLGKFVRASMW